jgi:hypothetical protein
MPADVFLDRLPESNPLHCTVRDFHITATVCVWSPALPLSCVCQVHGLSELCDFSSTMKSILIPPKEVRH